MIILWVFPSKESEEKRCPWAALFGWVPPNGAGTRGPPSHRWTWEGVGDGLDLRLQVGSMSCAIAGHVLDLQPHLHFQLSSHYTCSLDLAG